MKRFLASLLLLISAAAVPASANHGAVGIARVAAFGAVNRVAGFNGFGVRGFGFGVPVGFGAVGFGAVNSLGCGQAAFSGYAVNSFAVPVVTAYAPASCTAYAPTAYAPAAIAPTAQIACAAPPVAVQPQIQACQAQASFAVAPTYATAVIAAPIVTPVVAFATPLLFQHHAAFFGGGRLRGGVIAPHVVRTRTVTRIR
jgi:hypothetical protein